MIAQPIVKWAGGKRQLLAMMDCYLPRSYGRYYEPFVGGAALFFHLAPKQAILNDLNKELINLYQVVKEAVEPLLEQLKLHENTQSYYYMMRALDRDEHGYSCLSRVERASRFLYLNRTCFNGLYRVNRKGQFNVPFGRYKNPLLANAPLLRQVHRFFNERELEFYALDFENFFEQVPLGRGDFVYLDPPYDPFEGQANFVQYAASGFGLEQQLKLKSICDTLTDRGVKFLLSNSATDFIVDLYQNYHVERVKARRIIASQVASRGAIDEVLVRNYLD